MELTRPQFASRCQVCTQSGGTSSHDFNGLFQLLLDRNVDGLLDNTIGSSFLRKVLRNFNGFLHHVWNRNVGLFNDALLDLFLQHRWEWHVSLRHDRGVQHSIKELSLWHFHSFLYSLNGGNLALRHNWHINDLVNALHLFLGIVLRNFDSFLHHFRNKDVNDLFNDVLLNSLLQHCVRHALVEL